MSDKRYDDILRQMQVGADKQPRLGEMAARIVQLTKEKGLSTEEAMRELQTEIDRRKVELEEMLRLADIENPDEATLKRMEEIIAEYGWKLKE